MEIFLNGSNPLDQFIRDAVLLLISYLLCGEVLAHQLKQNENIKGIKIHDVIALISQFADDTTLFLSYDLITLNEVVKTLTVVEQNTGLKINYDKTSFYRIGSLRESNAMLYTSKCFNWCNDVIDVLGVQIGNDVEAIKNHDFTTVLNKSEAVLNSWMYRGLTMTGKILIINTLVGSLFVYRVSVLGNIVQSQIKKFNKLLRTFLWKGKKSKISLHTLQKAKESGGLHLVDLISKQEALKVPWVFCIQNSMFALYRDSHQPTCT